MTDEEFEKDLADLSEMLRYYRETKDRDRRKWLKAEIRRQLNTILLKS